MDTQVVESDDILLDSRNYFPRHIGKLSILNNMRDPDRTTDKYKATDDREVVQVLNQNGWFISDYKQVRARNYDKAQFRTYLATYTKEGLEVPGEGKLTLLQKGSHDGTKQLVFNLGFFRAVCANGMVTGPSLFEPITIKHIGDRPSLVNGLVGKVMGLAPLLSERISDMSKIELTRSQALDLAAEAMKLRFGEERPLEPADILIPVRYQDSGTSLWRVTNVIQERLIKKTGLIGKTKTNTYRQLKEVRSIDLSLKINAGLWDLAETYLR